MTKYEIQLAKENVRLKEQIKKLKKRDKPFFTKIKENIDFILDYWMRN